MKKQMAYQTDKKRHGRCCTAWLMWLAAVPVLAQFEAQMSQYMLNMPTYNPAAIAENGMININGQFRQQWIGWPGAPQTLHFTINTPLMTNGKSTHAVGIKFQRDAIGAFLNQLAHLQYTHKRTVGKGRLSIGADIGFVGVSFIADSVRADLNSEFHNFMGDAAIPTADDTGSNIDLSLGAFYSTSKYYIGISCVHLNAPRIRLNDDRTQFTVRGALYATAGYDLHLRDPKWMLRSSTLVKSDFRSWQAEVSSRLEYDTKFWGGIAYRYQDAVVVLAGVHLLNGLSIGLAYDVPASKAIKANWGTPEVLLSYSFVFDRKNDGSYKSIRIL